MDLIPVLDLMRGEVVRGQAGQRDQYRPNCSRIVSSSDPVQTCMALKEAFHPAWFYIADLDAIRQGKPPHPVLKSLVECGVPIAVDAGTSTTEQIQSILDLGVTKVIIGLESLFRMDQVAGLVTTFGADRLIFSLDLLDGLPVGPAAAHLHPGKIVADVTKMGIRHLIVLEFSHIGTSRGVPTISFCHSIKDRRSDLIVWTGGGVRHLADLHRLQLARVDGAMVASALHDGLISPADWQSYETMEVDETLLAMDA